MNPERRFRDTLGEFVTGVVVITARGPSDELIGMTMSSFNSVSVTPPLVLFSVDRRAKSLDRLLAVKTYAVNVLARDQERISNQFARALSNKWADVDIAAGRTGAPLIADALAHFECEPYANYDGGDHVIFLGRVVHHAMRKDSATPLVFFRSRYQSLDEGSAREPAWPIPAHYW